MTMTARMVYPRAPAIDYARNQSKHGPSFHVGTCLEECSQAFLNHPSGEDTAALAWNASKKKHALRRGEDIHAFMERIPRAFPVFFAGGSPTRNHPEGDGHVVISGATCLCWSTDRNRAGFFDHVLIASILSWNRTHPLRLLGWTEDIAGFMIPYKPHSKDAHPYPSMVRRGVGD